MSTKHYVFVTSFLCQEISGRMKRSDIEYLVHKIHKSSESYKIDKRKLNIVLGVSSNLAIT